MDNCNRPEDHTPKATYDPGWNDPPPLTFSTQQATKPRNFLNKRVAFPLSGSISSPVPAPVNLPPMPIPGMPPCAVPISTAKTDVDDQPVIDSESTLKEIKEILLGLLEKCCELGPKANDVKRRIEIMEGMWTDGKLNNRIQVLMRELTYALRDDKPNKADEIHQALMVSHVSSVGTWMPGVKQLIHLCIARTELLAIDKE